MDLPLGLATFISDIGGLQLTLSLLGMRAIIWSFQGKPCRRVGVATKGDTQTPSTLQTATDAFDLSTNLRGHGWAWSAGVKIPPETRPTSSTSAFISSTTTSLILHGVLFDLLHYCVQWFDPLTIGSAVGGTIFDFSMPPAQRYLRSSTITLLSCFMIYSLFQTGYDICTLLGVLVFRQHISLWPPLFRDPWFATSLTELWADRWHQLFREIFVSLGGRPMARLLGRVGGLFGSFFLSGLLHHVGLWGMGNGSDFRKVVGFFVMMGTGIIMEHIFRLITGQRVSGFFGWLWMSLWVIGWAHILAEAWATHGVMGSVFFPRSFRPAFRIFGPLP